MYYKKKTKCPMCEQVIHPGEDVRFDGIPRAWHRSCLDDFEAWNAESRRQLHEDNILTLRGMAAQIGMDPDEVAADYRQRYAKFLVRG